MPGYTTKQEGDKLIIVVDLKSNLGRSKSGKSLMIATSSGITDAGNDIKLGLNVFKKA